MAARFSLRICMLCLAFIVSHSALANPNACRLLFPPYKFGLEFTVTNQAIVDEGNARPGFYGLAGNPLKEEAWKNLQERVKEKCAKSMACKTMMSSDKHGPALKVIFDDGYYFTIGIDSCALETNAKPVSPEEYVNTAEKRLQTYFFESAHEVGLDPHIRTGQGHIHISRKAFDENALLFRNFFVDFQNRPELINGALGNHLGNSAPLSALKPGPRDALNELLKSFDPSKTSINTFIAELHSKVFTEGFVPEWGSPKYYQAFNMTRMMKDIEQATLEIRSFRPQENAHIFYLETRLLERWLERLRDLKKPIPYLAKDRYQFSNQESVDSFAQLLAQLDLPFDEYRVLLPPQMRRIVPTNRTSVPYQLESFK